jgi:nicotinamide riboside kinase
MAERPQDQRQALRIAIVGAESTGKSTLAAALAAALATRTLGHGGAARVAHVDEWLRTWCEQAGRTPRADEQPAIAAEQQRRIDAAAAMHDIVVCDTTPLMTAVYSRLLFADRSLEAQALAWHARVQLTLLTALDLPWVADGHQRDGEHVREPVDAALRELLLGARLPFAVIGGRGEARTAGALAALTALPALAPALTPAIGPALAAATPTAPRAGLFTRLGDDDAEAGLARADWRCECCIEGDAERRLRKLAAGRETPVR